MGLVGVTFVVVGQQQPIRVPRPLVVLRPQGELPPLIGITHTPVPEPIRSHPPRVEVRVKVRVRVWV